MNLTLTTDYTTQISADDNSGSRLYRARRTFLRYEEDNITGKGVLCL